MSCVVNMNVTCIGNITNCQIVHKSLTKEWTVNVLQNRTKMNKR